MKIVTDKYLYICAAICGLLLVYFTSVYILLVIVVFVSYLHYVSHPTAASFKLRTAKQLSNLWNSSFFLTPFDNMYQQNSSPTYRLHRNRTFNKPRRSSNTLSSRENDTENTSLGTYHSEYDSEDYSYRSSDGMCSSLEMNKSFNISRRPISPNSPWGISVSPKLRNCTSYAKTVQTLAGPLVASTKFNRSLDSGLLGNVSSPGLSSRIAHSARENAEVLTHQKKYGRPGDFPLVQLDRSASRLQTLSPRNTHKLSRTSVTVRIAPPESSELRYSALLDRSPQSLGGMDHDTLTAEMNTKSLSEVFKVSQKRIHAQMEENEEIKRQCKGEASVANDEQESRLTPVLNDVSGCKRMRKESPEEQNVEQMNHQSRKRTRNNTNNEILSSLSSSRNLLKFIKKSAKKRKSTAKLLANSAPVAKKQSRVESPQDPVPVSAGDTAPNSNKQNTSSDATVKSPTSSSKTITITGTSSPAEMHDSATFSEIIQKKSCEKSSSKLLADEDIPQQRMSILIDNIDNKELATNTASARFSLSRAPTVPVGRVFLEEKMNESTKITSDDSKTSNTEVKDSNISIRKSPSSVDICGLISSAPNTTLHNTSTTSVVSVSASASVVQTSTTQCTGSATPVQSSPSFSGLTSPTLVASSLNTSLKTSAVQSTANSEQPTTKTDISISPSFVSSTSASNVSVQAFSISLPVQSSTSTKFGATQTTAAIPNSLSSVKSSIFAIGSVEQPIQTSSFASTTNAPSNETSVVQVSAVSSNNNSSNNNNNKGAEMHKPSSPQLSFGAISSAKDTVAIGSSQVQSTQVATLFSSSQVQPTQASSVFGSSLPAQSTQFITSPQVQSTQATIAFGSATSTQSNPVFPVSNSSVQATTASGFTASQPSVQPKSLFSVPQTSQQTSTGGMFPSVQSSALFRTSTASSQPQSALSFGGSATAETVQTSIFGPKQTDISKTSSANQSAQAGKLFGTSSSLGVQPAQTATMFSTSPADTTIQASVFGNSGTTQTTAGSNIFASTSVVSSTQSEVKLGINAQSSKTLQTKSSFVLPSASLAFGSSVSSAQNTGGFQIAKPTSETDSGVGTSACGTVSSGFGSVSSKQSPQNAFSFGGATPSSAASQTASIFGTPTSHVTPQSSTQTSLSFGTSTLQSSGTFTAPQSDAVILGGFGAFSGSVAKTTTENNAVTGKNSFASTALAINNTPVFGTQTTNAICVFGGTKTEEKPAPFGFGSTKPNDSSTNIFQSNTTSNQSNTGGFKFYFTSPTTTKENATGTSSSQTTTPAFQFGTPRESKPAFGFGGASSINNTLKPAVGGFGNNLFGSTPITTSSTTPQSNIFAFGGASNPSSGPASSTNNAFAFGAASSAPSTSGAFTFGSTSQPSSSNVFGFSSAQTTTSTAQNASGDGGLFKTSTLPALQFGNAPSQAGSTGGFGFGNSGSSVTPVNFTAGPASNSSTFQPGPSVGFAFGNSGPSASPINFTAGPSPSSSTFQPGTTGNMFSIGSGSTGPRARARSRRQR